MIARIGHREGRGQRAPGTQREIDARTRQPCLDARREGVVAEPAHEGRPPAEAGQAHRDVGGRPARLGRSHPGVTVGLHQIHQRLAEHENGAGTGAGAGAGVGVGAGIGAGDRGVRHGSTTILRPIPAWKRSIACGYCSSGSRSLMNTDASSTPLAKSAAARS